MFRKLLYLVRDSLVYGMGSVLGQLVSFLLLPLYTRYLNVDDYGVLSMLGVLPIVFPTLVGAGMKSATFQRYHRAPDDYARGTMLGTGLITVVVSGLIWLALGMALAPQLNAFLVRDPHTVSAVRLTVLAAFFAVLGDLPLAVLQLRRQAFVVAMLNVAQVVVTTLVTVPLVVWLGWGVDGVLTGVVIGTALRTLGNYAFCWREFTLRWSKQIWREMTAYGLPFIPHRFQAVGMVYLGKYLINRFYGLEDAGLYDMAEKFVLPISLVTNAVLQGWQPYKFKIYGEDPDPKSFYRAVLTYYSAGLSYLYVGICLWGPELLRLMTAPKFHPAASVIWAVALVPILAGLHPILATGVEVSNNTKRMPLASLAGLIAVAVLCALLIQPLGLIGAALATAGGWLAIVVANYFISRQVYPIPFELKTVAEIVLLTAVAAVVAVMAQQLTMLYRWPVLLGVTLVYPTLLYLLLLRSPAEQERMRLLWGRLRGLRRRKTSHQETAAEAAREEANELPLEGEIV